MPQRVTQPAPRVATPTTTPHRPRPTIAAAPADATRTAGWQAQPKKPKTLEPAPTITLPADITSSNGVPVFKQGDARWGHQRLGDTTTISRSGCAMSSSAMAMSAISGKPVTPEGLNAWLKDNKGYAGDALDWSRVGRARNLDVRRESFTRATIDAQLDAGRPVVIGVDYKAGSNGGSNGTDHWVCITGKSVGADGKVTYSANDPGTGKVITLTPNAKGQGLSGDGQGALGHYKTTGELRVFVPRE